MAATDFIGDGPPKQESKLTNILARVKNRAANLRIHWPRRVVLGEPAPFDILPKDDES